MMKVKKMNIKECGFTVVLELLKMVIFYMLLMN